MTDSELDAAYQRATGRSLQGRHIADARAFILAVFDLLAPAAYIDGSSFAEEEWMLPYPTALYRRPD